MADRKQDPNHRTDPQRGPKKLLKDKQQPALDVSGVVYEKGNSAGRDSVQKNEGEGNRTAAREPTHPNPWGIAGRSDEHHVQAKLACDESISELRVVIGFTAIESVTHQPPSHDNGGNHASVRLLPRGSPRACSRPTSREERLVHRDCNCGVHHCIRIDPLALSADANRCYGTRLLTVSTSRSLDRHLR